MRKYGNVKQLSKREEKWTYTSDWKDELKSARLRKPD